MPDLLASFNAAYPHGEMSVSQRRGVITLILKDDSNLLELSNWNPLQLDFRKAFFLSPPHAVSKLLCISHLFCARTTPSAGTCLQLDLSIIINR